MAEWTLEKSGRFPGVKGPVVACVMDGVGYGRRDESDAVWLARTPTLDWLANASPSTELVAHGKAVGMPSDGDMGNSEVGHNAIGAGRVFDQGAKLVAKAISDGTLFDGEQAGVWQGVTERVRERGATLHFLGLLSDGNVHSHIDHIFALLRRCDLEQVERVRLHVLLDGRDVPETSALDYVDALEELLETISGKPNRDYRPWIGMEPTGPWSSAAGRRMCAATGVAFPAVVGRLRRSAGKRLGSVIKCCRNS